MTLRHDAHTQLHRGAYAASCSSCVLTDSGATLYCYCDSTYASNNKDTFIDLGKDISPRYSSMPWPKK